jgi:hypothetical protein
MGVASDTFAEIAIIVRHIALLKITGVIALVIKVIIKRIGVRIVQLFIECAHDEHHPERLFLKVNFTVPVKIKQIKHFGFLLSSAPCRGEEASVPTYKVAHGDYLSDLLSSSIVNCDHQAVCVPLKMEIDRCFITPWRYRFYGMLFRVSFKHYVAFHIIHVSRVLPG